MHNAAMSVDITFEDLPSETLDKLTARAARRGLSLQEFLRTTLTDMADKPDVNDLLARARKRAIGSELTIDAILDHRAAERR